MQHNMMRRQAVKMAGSQFQIEKPGMDTKIFSSLRPLTIHSDHSRMRYTPQTYPHSSSQYTLQNQPNSGCRSSTASQRVSQRLNVSFRCGKGTYTLVSSHTEPAYHLLQPIALVRPTVGSCIYMSKQDRVQLPLLWIWGAVWPMFSTFWAVCVNRKTLRGASRS